MKNSIVAQPIVKGPVTTINDRWSMSTDQKQGARFGLRPD